MSVSIISCPSCDAMLLDDTVQCPTCRHVLKPDEFAASGLATVEPRDETGATESNIGEVACPACGEGVRSGLVRCWNCGTFMDSAVQQAFSQIQSDGVRSGDSIPIYSGSSEDDVIPLAAESAYSTSSGEDSSDSISQAMDDDFEVSPEFELRMPSLSLGAYSDVWENSVPDAVPPAEAAPETEGDSYALATPAYSEPLAEATQEPAPEPEEAAPIARSDAAPSSRSQAEDFGDAVPHSEATGGDVLLDIALKEEQLTQQRKARGPRRKTTVKAKNRFGMLVFCPNGHRIEVQEKHRGLMGRCPKCKMPFFVPSVTENANAGSDDALPANGSPSASVAASSAAASSSEADLFAEAPRAGGMPWLQDIPLHVANPAKMKAKPDCLAKSFQPVDLVAQSNGLLVVTLVKPGGLFGLGAKKPEPVRQEVQAHLMAGKAIAESPAASIVEVPSDAVASLRIIQPAVYAHECPFGDVPVFGEGRIAVQLPTPADVANKQFLSFSLTQFRQFAELMRSVFGHSTFGENSGVPLVDSHSEVVCHYSDSRMQVLDDIAFYKADPAIKLDVIGRRCAGCGLIVSEDARKKEKIGGLDGKGIAKAKCPKCAAKFGDISLHTRATS